MNNEMCGCNGTCGTEEKTNTAKGIVRINYKEDFELVVELLAGDKPYKLGEEDFRIDFIVMASRYTVGRTGGVCERCSVDGNKIRCFLDGHGLPPGELRAEVKVNTPDPNYADGKRLNVAIAEGVVVLVKDNTRFDGAVVKANIPVALVDAYQLAKAHGYKGTIDEYYATFTEVGHLKENIKGTLDEMTEAEKLRATAETERAKAEAVRQSNRDKFNTAESERVKNEQQRQTNEDARQTAETERVKSEVSRIQAEKQRQTDEKLREQAETQRANSETARKGNEDARIRDEHQRNDTEQARKIAETQRQTKEEARKSSETQRKTAEEQRQQSEAKRVNAESNRASAEVERGKAEQQRISMEQARQTSENQRRENEQARFGSENARFKWEEGRKQAETQRQTDEELRKQAEADRQKNRDRFNNAEEERVKNEQQRNATETERVAAEKQRNSTEQARKTAETERQTNEDARKQAETERATAEGKRADTDKERDELVAKMQAAWQEIERMKNVREGEYGKEIELVEKIKNAAKIPTQNVWLDATDGEIKSSPASEGINANAYKYYYIGRREVVGNVGRCTNKYLRSLDLTNWDTHAMTRGRDMFSGCSSLQYLDVSNWNIAVR